MNDDPLRVVVIKKGKIKASDFRLREGEIGLSLFVTTDPANCAAIIAAVRAAGKQGELGLAQIPGELIHQLSLRLVPTLGNTPDAQVNRLHVEARPTRWRQILLWFRRYPIHAWFNDTITQQLAASAKVLEGDYS